MNYKTASDFELNKRLAELLGNENVLSTPAKNIDGGYIGSGSAVASLKNTYGVARFFYFDYCGSWSDIGPVAFDLGIDIISPYSNG